MPAPIIDDELWALIEPLLPPPKPLRKRYPGRLPVSDRAALNGILLGLKTGMRWNRLPTRLGFGSGATCWRRLHDWQQAGGCCSTSCANLPSPISHMRLSIHRPCDPWSRPKTGPNPTDRARPGSRHHVRVDANGVPVSAILTGANRNNVTQLLPLVDAIPPIPGTRGGPLRKPKVIYADRGYDSDSHRRRLRERGIRPVIARRRTEHGSGLGKFRWVVERTHSWLHGFRRLRIRFERRSDIHEAFLKLACSLVCWSIFSRTERPF
ncbi:IS5 family transposase [Burkholderia ubonensis]|uniref:IS5 family transposase n=1 Tax=Burkholderia ubonensis TaxID=101571 RepID=UPI00211705AE|nr:IS5 family transposase [Burkholderia ubonensis]